MMRRSDILSRYEIYEAKENHQILTKTLNCALAKGDYGANMLFGASGQVALPTLGFPQEITDCVNPYITVLQGEESNSFSTEATLRGLRVENNYREDITYCDQNNQKWVADSLDLDSGVLIRRICRKIFNGSESWLEHPNVSNTYRILAFAPASNLEYFNYKILCNAYRGESYISADLLEDFSGCVYNGAAIMIKDTNIPDVQAFKEHLANLNAAGNPLSVEFILAAPTVEYLTPFSLKTYDGTTEFICGATGNTPRFSLNAVRTK